MSFPTPIARNARPTTHDAQLPASAGDGAHPNMKATHRTPTAVTAQALNFAIIYTTSFSIYYLRKKGL